MPLILTHNEVNLSDDTYADVWGERYEYPWKYKNLIQPDERFVYYRSGRRKKGSRQTPAYLGTGVIGVVTEVTSKLFQCTVVSFAPFKQPLPFKDAEGRYREPEANHRKAVGYYFEPGVREIDEAVYQAIVAAAKAG